ncbi:hypothetical protein PM082_004263 [Marasmius tenuissimus]|nr:hypothetical protein PM082_004263 [Marasmius tenuissimus]
MFSQSSDTLECPDSPILLRDCRKLVSRHPILHSVGFFLYGIHTVLYLICIYILLTRKQDSKHRHAILITALYLVSTVGIGLKHNIYTLEAHTDLSEYSYALYTDAHTGYDPHGETQKTIEGMMHASDWDPHYLKLRLGLEGITIVGNCSTDILLLWRCYLTFAGTARRAHIMAFPSLCAFGINVYGLVMTIHQRNMTCNLLLTLLIAGRIFYIVHQVRAHLTLRTSIPQMYRTVISATLESGSLYPVALAIFTLCIFTGDETNNPTTNRGFRLKLVFDTMFDSLITIMGIASTLIVVRVSLGIAIHDETSFKETVVMKDIESNPEVTCTRGTVIDICQQSTRSITNGAVDMRLDEAWDEGKATSQLSRRASCDL